jgi:hypothetical protein
MAHGSTVHSRQKFRTGRISLPLIAIAALGVYKPAPLAFRALALKIRQTSAAEISPSAQASNEGEDFRFSVQ